VPDCHHSIENARYVFPCGIRNNSRTQYDPFRVPAPACQQRQDHQIRPPHRCGLPANPRLSGLCLLAENPGKRRSHNAPAERVKSCKFMGETRHRALDSCRPRERAGSGRSTTRRTSPGPPNSADLDSAHFLLCLSFSFCGRDNGFSHGTLRWLYGTHCNSRAFHYAPAILISCREPVFRGMNCSNRLDRSTSDGELWSLLTCVTPFLCVTKFRRRQARLAINPDILTQSLITFSPTTRILHVSRTRPTRPLRIPPDGEGPRPLTTSFKSPNAHTRVWGFDGWLLNGPPLSSDTTRG